MVQCTTPCMIELGSLINLFTWSFHFFNVHSLSTGCLDANGATPRGRVHSRSSREIILQDGTKKEKMHGFQ